MSAAPDANHTFRVSKLSQNAPTPFAVVHDSAARAQIAEQLGLKGVRKITFKGEIIADGRDDWRLVAHLGATVVQACVVTLAPVTTRIEEDITRRYIKEIITDDAPEVEMPEDDTLEPLGAWIDVNAVMIESLTLALPLYPRAEGAAIEAQQFAAPGVAPMSDEDAKPFAGLAGLRAASDKTPQK